MALVLYRQAIAADQSLPTRTFLLPQSVELTLRQQKAVEPSAQLGQVGLVVWQGAFVLVEYLLRSHTDWAGKRVVELGAGTGLCGLALARLGAHVELTDMEHILPILRENVATNPSGKGGSMHVSELVWGDADAVQRLRPHECDVVLGAECVYQEEHFESLLATLDALLCAPGAHAWLSFCQRGRGESAFVRLASEAFQVEQVELAELHEEYRDGRYHVLRIHRRCPKYIS